MKWAVVTYNGYGYAADVLEFEGTLTQAQDYFARRELYGDDTADPSMYERSLLEYVCTRKVWIAPFTKLVDCHFEPVLQEFKEWHDRTERDQKIANEKLLLKQLKAKYESEGE